MWYLREGIWDADLPRLRYPRHILDFVIVMVCSTTPDSFVYLFRWLMSTSEMRWLLEPCSSAYFALRAGVFGGSTTIKLRYEVEANLELMSDTSYTTHVPAVCNPTEVATRFARSLTSAEYDERQKDQLGSGRVSMYCARFVLPSMTPQSLYLESARVKSVAKMKTSFRISLGGKNGEG